MVQLMPEGMHAVPYSIEGYRQLQLLYAQPTNVFVIYNIHRDKLYYIAYKKISVSSTS